MADNYLQFSTVIEKLSKKEREYIENHLNLFGHDAPQEGDQKYKEFIQLLDIYHLDQEDEPLGFQYNFQDDYIHIFSEDGGSPEHLAAFLHLFIKKFRPNDALCFSWSETCSKMRVGEFSGGACFVTAQKIHWNGAYDWCEKQWKKFRKENQ